MRNWVIAGGALIAAIFVFVANIVLTRLQRPPIIEVVAAARDLPPGHKIGPNDVTLIEVYQDDRAQLYFSAEQEGEVIGAYTARAFTSGEPIVRGGLLIGSRLSALSVKDPGTVLFPIPLELSNVVAGAPGSYQPGDPVGIGVAFVERPRKPTSPESLYVAPQVTPPFAATEVPPLPPSTLTPTPTPGAEMPFEDRGLPPVVRILRPGRVVLVTGLPTPPPLTEGEQEPASPYTGYYDEPVVLWVALDADDVELLTLALARGMVFVYLSHPEAEERPGGFSYWDFEEMLRSERLDLMQGSALTPSPQQPLTPTYTPTPTFTPTPTTVGISPTPAP